MPYRVAADLLQHVLPIDAGTSPETLRSHTLQVRKRLGYAAAEKPPIAATAITISLDSTFIRSRDDGERHLEVRVVTRPCIASVTIDRPKPGRLLRLAENREDVFGLETDRDQPLKVKPMVGPERPAEDVGYSEETIRTSLRPCLDPGAAAYHRYQE
jgi:hypothetical protein